LRGATWRLEAILFWLLTEANPHWPAVGHLPVLEDARQKKRQKDGFHEFKFDFVNWNFFIGRHLGRFSGRKSSDK
jgi:hypothetical protein